MWQWNWDVKCDCRSQISFSWGCLPKEQAQKEPKDKSCSKRTAQEKAAIAQEEIQYIMMKYCTTKSQAQRNMRRGWVCYPFCSSFCFACISFTPAMPHAGTQHPSQVWRVQTTYANVSGQFSIFLEIETWLASCQTEKSLRNHTQDLSLLLSHFSTFASCLTWFIRYYLWILIFFFLSPDTYSDYFGLSAPLGETTSQNLLFE